ncbi:endonuclease/exonuclease/phosphatase family protein [Flavobacteriaceae bacterium]|nr:endonuclease/exonuclease/phosphatase family protein [Flavobacteriaceae bacterium]
MINKYILKILFFSIILINQSLRSQEKTEKNTIVKFLSFNILHGKTMKGNFDLDLIAKVIVDTDPDFVALQEVDYKTNRSKKYDLVTELGWRTKMAPIFGRAMHYNDGEYGEGILSKHTFLSTRNIPLPFTPGDEPRAALEITAVLPSKDTISFIGTHLDHLVHETNRIMQAKAINQVFSPQRYPTVLAGDLNAEPHSETMKILGNLWETSYNQLHPQQTFPSDNPSKKIDYILFYPRHYWKVLERKVICDTIASDHCAYLVTLQIIE